LSADFGKWDLHLIELHKISAVALNQRAPPFIAGRKRGKLDQADGGVQFTYAIVVTEFDHVVVERVSFVPVQGQSCHAVRAKQSGLICKVGTVGRQHSAFPRRHILVREETKATNVAPQPHRHAIEPGSRRMRCVFDDGQTATPGKLHDPRHVARIACVMDDNDRARAHGNHRLDGAVADVPVFERFDVGENRFRTAIADGVCSRDESEGGTNDLVARPDAEAHQRNVERCSAVAYRDCMPRSYESSET
jgi:hypothetical protein